LYFTELMSYTLVRAARRRKFVSPFMRLFQRERLALCLEQLLEGKRDSFTAGPFWGFVLEVKTPKHHALRYMPKEVLSLEALDPLTSTPFPLELATLCGHPFHIPDQVGYK
jgi:hypothetical protein